VKPIDLRSDTVTQPTPAMREAMARAPLGDDVYGEDPSVNALEAAAAARVGKEAAVFVPSGTMANQIAIRLHTHHAEVVLAGAGAHVLRYEGGAASALAGVQIATIGEAGLFSAADVRAAYVPPTNVHLAPATLLVAEDTHNGAGGRVFPVEALHEAVRAAQDLGMRAHLDGARIFDAEVASGIPAARIAQPFDTVAFCFSKGLGAPVGSVLCGSRDSIERARRLRKMLGGGMRQAGVLAAAGIYAIEHHLTRLAEDHANARALAEALVGAKNLAVDLSQVHTNIVMIDVLAGTALAVIAVAREEGVLLGSATARRIRAVTHLDVNRDAVMRAARVIADIAATLA